MSTALQWILASASPRRKALLALRGHSFDARSADLNEDPLPDEEPTHYVLRLAEEKARAAADRVKGANLIIAADTTVVFESQILGKPENADEARRMLISMRGKTHQVFTGLALLRTVDGMLVTDLAESEVPMRDYSDSEIDTYVASGDPYDKAGAYAIQSEGFHPVEGLAACYANVVGLPLCHLERNLRRLTTELGMDIASACQAHLGYDCPVYDEVLNWKQ